MFLKKKHIWYVVLVCVVVVAIAMRFLSAGNGEVPTYESTEVERGTVSRVVNVTGHVEPVERILLAFPAGGRLANVLVSEGDSVAPGAPLAQLDTTASAAAVLEAEARVARERAVLAELMAPVRTVTRSYETASVAQAEVALVGAERTARTTLTHAHALADDAIHEEVDELFERRGSLPRFGTQFSYGSTVYFIRADSQTESELNALRARVRDILTALQDRAAEEGDVGVLLNETSSDLKEIDSFLTLLANVVNRYVPDDTAAQSVYESYQTSVASARSAISTALSEVASVYAAYESARAGLEKAQRALDLAVVGVADEKVVSQERAIEMAERGVDTARARLVDSSLTAPIAGVVTKVMVSRGETVSPHEPVLELLTEGAYEIEAYIPEADIASVSLGDLAEVTLDAFGGDEVVQAEVVRIALSETMREGVPTYKTTLMVSSALPEDMLLRPGMTANVDIMTAQREDVVLVPTRSVQREGDREYVRVVEEGVIRERAVTTGLRGSEGVTEVVEGLAVGEEVVVYME